MEVGCVRTYLEPPKKMQNNSIQLYCIVVNRTFSIFFTGYYTIPENLKETKFCPRIYRRISYDFLFQKNPQKVWWKKTQERGHDSVWSNHRELLNPTNKGRRWVKRDGTAEISVVCGKVQTDITDFPSENWGCPISIVICKAVRFPELGAESPSLAKFENHDSHPRHLMPGNLFFGSNNL